MTDSSLDNISPEEAQVYRALDSQGIAYERYAHGAAFTMQDCAQIDAAIPATHAKNLFLCNRQKTQYYLVILRMDKPFRTAEVSRQIGVSRLSFASEEDMRRILQLAPGAVSPMALIHGSARDVVVLIDRDVAGGERLCFHPNVNTASIVVSNADFFAFLRACGNPMTRIDVPSHSG